ncbi:MAG: hypothetical protein F4Y94_08545 [Chloroflexi bacterium]|nr:hypothetical protein [Chloroflexota bacterium]
MPTPLFGSLAHRPLLVVALLIAALLAALPAAASAQQTEPPRLYWGSNDTVTVDGQPWDGSTIQVIDEDDTVVATVERESMSWSVEIPNDAGAFRFRASNGSLSELFDPPKSTVEENFILTIGSVTVERPTREVALVAGWNWVVWTGHTQSVTDVLETFPDTSQLTVIFERVAVGQRWSSYRPGLPARVQSIAELRSGVAYILIVDSALTWEMPSDGDLTGTRTIAAGFSAIGWAGPDATPQEVLDAVADPGAVAAFFRWNTATQMYDSYRPGLPARVQRIDTIRPFDVLFIHATSATTITQ